MPSAHLALATADADFSAGVDRLLASLGLADDFSIDSLVEADVAALALPSLITGGSGYADRTDLELVSLDPVGTTDIDQAVFVERQGSGYRVWQAIADAPYFVWPGGELEAESFRRGHTIYAPGRRRPLYPPVVGEGVGSLLADGKPRLAALWQIDLDAAGAVVAARVSRAVVRNREQVDYETAQAELDAGTASPTLELVAEVGRLRQAQEAARGGVSLDVPELVAERAEAPVDLREQDAGPSDRHAPETDSVTASGDMPESPHHQPSPTDPDTAGGDASRPSHHQPSPTDPDAADGIAGWRLSFRPLTAIQGWNAQISRLTGVVAARMMLDAGVGIVRLASPARPAEVERLRRIAARLGIPWPATIGYPDVVRQLRPDEPSHLALRHAARTLFRSPGYETFDRGAPIHSVAHAAVGLPYAHVTAPLRRLADRFGAEICLAASAGVPPPPWVTRHLTRLPAVMVAGEARKRQVEAGALDRLIALTLADAVGQTFPATVVAAKGHRATVLLREPTVEVTVPAAPRLGSEVTVRLAGIDHERGRAIFELA